MAASRLLADGLPSTPYVYLQGEATKQVEPDLITISFKISKTNSEIEVAKTQIEQKGRELFELCDSLKIARADVTVFEISMEPSFTSGKMEERKFAGYTTTRNFTLTLRDLVKYGPMIKRLLAAKIERIERNTYLGSSKEKEIRSALIEESLLNARKDADATAAKLGRKVKSVFSVSRIPPTQILGEMFPYVDSDGGCLGKGLGINDSHYSFGKVTLHENAFVTFLIEPAKL